MAENTNMRIWDAVSKTDPGHTKKVTFGRTFTSIDAHWQIQQATNQFGPIGDGWGYGVEHSVLVLTPEMILAVADVTIRWGAARNSYGPIRATCEMYGPKTKQGKIIVGEFVTDEDAPKKAMTDALTKGLSHLGFSADVFLGLFDDHRYVQKVEKGFAAKQFPVDPDVAAGSKRWIDDQKLHLKNCKTQEEVDGWVARNRTQLSKLYKEDEAAWTDLKTVKDEALDRVRAPV